ncbi:MULTISPECIES: putative bifunctional diguanylate cyclase/phosphodiesterase [Mesorhizobium]|uniref:EAL domain-containing protein n=1 Tax=Mesorhizobium denitrificans TaxID=2294114 RepID=A0A371XCI1_9HYPH|nr:MULTISPECIES: EAL domain-containing protein [Mesorhizobium]RFC66930.1 EAL domain-containing protein [Mesorhizobium denitrificans]
MVEAKSDKISDDIYLPFVETLFRDGFTLAIGIFAQSALITLVWLNTGNSAYLTVLTCLLAVGAIRLVNMRHINAKLPATTRAEAQKRENYYILFGAMHGATLGCFSLVAIYSGEDSFSETAAVCIALATATGIAGRNYGSPRMVNILVIALTLPMAMGFILRGDFFHVALGLLSIPFLLAIQRYATTVREVLFAAISAQNRANGLAERFNRALNTMSHGLIMLSKEGRVVVANGQAAKMLGMPSADAMLGRTSGSLLRRITAAGLIGRAESDFISAQLGKNLREGIDRKITIGLNDGRFFETSAREGRYELGVITFEDVTQRVQAEEKIRAMARFDDLTALPNRNYFQELIGQRLADGNPQRLCGLMVIDLDDFKSVNDKFGHPVGDGLLYEVGRRIGRISGDVVCCRFGGDEFMIFYNNVRSTDQLSSIAESTFAAIEGPTFVAGNEFRIRLSIGIACEPANNFNIETMIVKADLALHVAKKNGKARWQLFEPRIDEAFRTRQRLIEDLRAAVEKGGLNVVYQPIISSKTMRVVSCEALCRWNHPELGVISPAIFIPLAEEIGIISGISRYVLKAATLECAKWPERIGVSVNLSAKDFHDDSVVGTVREALANSGLDPARLVVEVTETALLNNKLETAAKLAMIRAEGVRIALDDFGTGYSALSYLHRLPIDKIKIDRSFVSDIATNKHSLKLIAGIVGLCHSLGKSVTVEGIETFDQLSALLPEARPETLQGFLFGSALTANGIKTMSTAVWQFGAPPKPRSSQISKNR